METAMKKRSQGRDSAECGQAKDVGREWDSFVGNGQKSLFAAAHLQQIKQNWFLLKKVEI